MRGPQLSNTKSASNKPQALSSSNQMHSDPMSQHTSNVCSPTVLNDITNSKRNNQPIQPKNPYLVSLLPSESISFSYDCKTEPSSLLATRKGSDTESNYPFMQGALASNSKHSFGNENFSKEIPFSSSGKCEKENQFLKKTAPAINFSQSSNVYNIEDFLPEPTFLKINNYHGNIGLNSSINVGVSNSGGYQNPNMNALNSNIGQLPVNPAEKTPVLSQITHDLSAIGYSNSNGIGGTASNAGLTQKKADFKAPYNQNLHDASQIDSSITDSFSNIGQTQLDHTIASEIETKIDERSREEIKKFVKTSLLDGEKPKNITSNEYADFLSRILIKLLENIPLLQTQSIKEGATHKFADSKNKSASKPKGRAQKLRIQHLEAINYVPEIKFRNEGIQVDSDLTESPYSNTRYMPGPTEGTLNKVSAFQNEVYLSDKPPIFSGSAAKHSQLLSKQGTLPRKDQKNFTMNTDLISLDELSESSMDHSNQGGSDTYFRSKLNNLKNKKANPGWENSKNTTTLSDTMDSELDFDIPRGRGSVNNHPGSAYRTNDEQARFSFKSRPPLEQTPFTQDKRKGHLGASLPRASSAKRAEYVPHLNEETNKFTGFLNTTARFNSNSTSFKDKNLSATDSERCFSSGRFSEKNGRNSYASGKKTTPFTEKSTRMLSDSERKLGGEIKKREVIINENNEVVFVEGPNSQESSMRGQETSSRGFTDGKFTSCTNSAIVSGHRSPSPHFTQSKNLSLSRSSNEDWSPSRVQLEYSVSNSHVSRMNSLAAESISKTGRNVFESKSAVKSNVDSRRRTESGINEQNDALFKSSLLATADFERNNSDSKILGWRPVRFGSREKVEEFFKYC